MKEKKSNYIVCRCEDVALEEIEHYLKKGYKNIEELKRLTRCGMGYCQGRTCFNLLMRLISDYALLPKKRPPLKPLPIKIFADFKQNGEE